MLVVTFFSWLLFIVSPAAIAVELSGAKPGCTSKCGSLNIPYPFGIGIRCAANQGLNIFCDTSGSHPRSFIDDWNDLEILNISNSEVRINNKVACTCYNQSGSSTDDYSASTNITKSTAYTFSSKNRFFSTGCNTNAFIQGRDEERYTSGCLSLCRDKESIADEMCSGLGCCQTSIPRGFTYYEFYLYAIKKDWIDEPWSIPICSYAFLADPNAFKFQASDIFDSEFLNKTEKHVPRVLDWVIEKRTCKEAQRNQSSYACQNNAVCVNSDEGNGYRCNCKHGYEGNPYLEPGCKDTNECADTSRHGCISSLHCKNTPGGHRCFCLQGTYGDGLIKGGKGCIPKRKDPTAKISLGFSLGILLLLIGSFWLYFGLKKRKLAKLKERFFKQNGGLLLQQHQISLHKNGGAARIYTAEELQKATNNYDESQIIGRGGNGTVYKGVLPPDNQIVAIKKSKVVDKTQIEQFINELVILTQINHKNVVKLLGCCLETQVPLLVYEFISNGTLYDHIHSRPNGGTVSSKFSWYNCLRIATEISRALAYLHSAASIPIIHRDVKSTNILLDDNYSAKVADFGASRLIPLDQTQVSTIVQGTLGYLDPECYYTSKLTEKSDVYSFGVVLSEILSGKTPLSFERTDECSSLATYFISAVKEKVLLQIVDDRLVNEADREQLHAVADLTMRCLAWKGEERPTMKDVLEELEGLMKLVQQHPWDQEDAEETLSLLDNQSDLYPIATFSLSMGEASGQYSLNLNNSLMSPLNIPR